MTPTTDQKAAEAVHAALAAMAPRMVETPILQPAGLYLELVGEDIRARAFTLIGPDGTELCLRPDMTAPVVRDALAAGLTGAVTLGYDGLVFRRQAQGSSRETEFRVVGAERLAPQAVGPQAEADLIAAVVDAARAAGARPHLKLGDVALARAIIASVGLAPAWAARIERAFARTGGAARVLEEAEGASAETNALGEALAGLPHDKATAAVEALLARSGVVMVGARTPADVARRLTAKSEMARAVRPTPEQIAHIRNALAIEGEPETALAALAKAAPGLGPALDAARARWAALAQRIDAPTTFSAGFGRGPGYYDGVVFELEDPRLGDRASLGGGGRYDALLAHLGADLGVTTSGWSALGFSLRPRRLADAEAAR